MAWNDKRPMSPHLQVYDLPITAKLSILHRITGAALTAGLIIIALALAAAAGGEESWKSMHGLLSSWFGYLVLFGFTFALYYHFCNGVRHLIWDMGKGLDPESVKQSGQYTVIATVVLTLVTWLIAII